MGEGVDAICALWELGSQELGFQRLLNLSTSLRIGYVPWPSHDELSTYLTELAAERRASVATFSGDC